MRGTADMQMTLAILVLLFGAFAASAQEPKPLEYEDPEGWFWYSEDEPQEASDAPEVAPPHDPPAQAEPATHTPDAATPPLAAEFVREQMPVFLDRALSTGDREDVRAYALLNRQMMDMSGQFARTFHEIYLTDPLLQESSSPVSAIARTMHLADKREGREAALRYLAENFGLFYFYDISCEYCTRQTPVLEHIANKYGFTVLGVALDGNHDPGLPWRSLSDSGVAERFKVQRVPAIVLANPPDTAAIVSQGLYAAPEIEHRMIVSAEQLDLLPDELIRAYDPRQGEFHPILDLETNEQLDLTDSRDFIRFYRQRLGIEE